MIVSALLFLTAMLVMAIYNFYSINGLTQTAIWHFCQYLLVGLLLLTGYYMPTIALTWHSFGQLAAIIGVGIAIYVVILHWLLANR